MKKLKLYVISLFVLSGILLTACAGGTSNSVVGTWRLDSYGAPGKTTPAAADVDTSIVFRGDGKIEGNVGCNGFGGDYTVEGNTITFGPIVSTLMFCEGPVGDQETTTLNVLAETVPYTLEGETLTITSSDGSAVIVLTTILDLSLNRRPERRSLWGYVFKFLQIQKPDTRFPG